jgi:NAD(P)-dependent dehydrogenase (short-subunit alcohol dehydrogenase family)
MDFRFTAEDDAWRREVRDFLQAQLPPGWAERGPVGEGGSVISVVSSLGMVPQKGYIAYGLAKGALMLLTKYVAQEFGPRVQADCISPGTIDTAGTMQHHPIAATTWIVRPMAW